MDRWSHVPRQPAASVNTDENSRVFNVGVLVHGDASMVTERRTTYLRLTSVNS